MSLGKKRPDENQKLRTVFVRKKKEKGKKSRISRFRENEKRLEVKGTGLFVTPN